MHRAGVRTTISNLRDYGGYHGITKRPFVKTFIIVKIISVVDPVVTFEIESLSFLDDYPGLHNTWWLTVDLSKAENINPFSAVEVENFKVNGMADLRTIFTKDVIRDAILANPEVSRSLRGDEGRAAGENLQKWIDRTADLSNPAERIPIGQLGLSLVEYSFQHFVFDRIENNKVAVRLALVNTAASNTYSNEYLEIFLPIDGKLGSQLAASSQGEGGFLENKQNSISKGCGTSIELHTPVYSSTKKGT